MGKVYRYVDLQDFRVKYVGIVYDSDRIKRRIEEHVKDFDARKTYRVDVLDLECSKIDLEYLEAHFISLYNAEYNKRKRNYGVSVFIPNLEALWKPFAIVGRSETNGYANGFRLRKQRGSIPQVSRKIRL